MRAELITHQKTEPVQVGMKFDDLLKWVVRT